MSLFIQKRRLSIGRRISLGFGLIIFLIVVNFILTFFTLRNSERINTAITEVYTPSVDVLEDLNLMVVRSKMLVSNWVFIVRKPDHPDKVSLKDMINNQYPAKKAHIEDLAAHWKEDERNQIEIIFKDIDSLFTFQKMIMSELNTFESYDDAEKIFIVRPMVEEGEVQDLTNKILKDLSKVIVAHRRSANKESDEMILSFNVLQFIVVTSGVILIFGGMLIAYLITRSIVKPVQRLRIMLLSLGRGIFPRDEIEYRNDEIGDMSIALNGLVEGLNRTTNFSKEIGSGNFDHEYQPLSSEDTLGQALLKMRDELKENERILEAKVIERTEQVVKQKAEIEEKNNKLEDLYKNVTDSIKYAKHIQESILPAEQFIKKSLPEFFIFYRPKDIVSGDFYWFNIKKDSFFISAVDCTGHGVPGAFMSIVGYNHLNQSLEKENVTAASLLDGLNQGVSKTLHMSSEGYTVKDGMDIALCGVDMKRRKLQFAGAYNPLYIVRDGKFSEIKADKFPIGSYMEDPRDYTNHEMDIQSGDTFYIFTDGYADQFGGPHGKKFMYKK
ncbi:MAG TPA: SpoIIE family protein phosphatase, partial [Cytophagaceae bacterium]|nr:SpoIIE family protein phosphatase [Cytophagaceae bacterium]